METKTRLVVDKAKFIPTSDQEVHRAALNTSQGGSRPLFDLTLSWKEDSNYKKTKKTSLSSVKDIPYDLPVLVRHRKKPAQKYVTEVAS